MCKTNFEIHFCTCASIQQQPLPYKEKGIERKKSECEKTQYIWTLHRYLGEKESWMLGEIRMPVDQLDREITTAYLIQELNSKKVFDFDYSPAQGDNLLIRKEYVYKKEKAHSRPDLWDFLSFIFRNGKWEADFYDVFTDKTRRINKGKIRIDFKDNIQ